MGLHPIAQSKQQILIIKHTVSIGNAFTVARNHFCIGARHSDRQAHSIDHAQKTAAVVMINNRIHIGTKDVSQEQDIRLGELKKAIATGMRRWGLEYPDLLPMRMKAYRLAESRNRLSGLSRHRKEGAACMEFEAPPESASAPGRARRLSRHNRTVSCYRKYDRDAHEC